MFRSSLVPTAPRRQRPQSASLGSASRRSSSAAPSSAGERQEPHATTTTNGSGTVLYSKWKTDMLTKSRQAKNAKELAAAQRRRRSVAQQQQDVPILRTSSAMSDGSFPASAAPSSSSAMPSPQLLHHHTATNSTVNPVPRPQSAAVFRSRSAVGNGTNTPQQREEAPPSARGMRPASATVRRTSGIGSTATPTTRIRPSSAAPMRSPRCVTPRSGGVPPSTPRTNVMKNVQEASYNQEDVVDDDEEERVPDPEILTQNYQFTEAVDAAHKIMNRLRENKRTRTSFSGQQQQQQQQHLHSPTNGDSSRLQLCIARCHLFQGKAVLASSAYDALLSFGESTVDVLTITAERRCVELFEEYTACDGRGDAPGALRAITTVCDVFAETNGGCVGHRQTGSQACKAALFALASVMRCSVLIQVDPHAALDAAITITEVLRPSFSAGWVLRSKAAIACYEHDEDLDKALRFAEKAAALEPASVRCRSQLRVCQSLLSLVNAMATLSNSGKHQEAMDVIDGGLKLCDSKLFQETLMLRKLQLVVNRHSSSNGGASTAQDQAGLPDALKQCEAAVSTATCVSREVELLVVKSKLLYFTSMICVGGASQKNQALGEAKSVAESAVKLAEKMMSSAQKKKSTSTSRPSQHNVHGLEDKKKIEQYSCDWLSFLFGGSKHQQDTRRQCPDSKQASSTGGNLYQVLGVSQKATRQQIVKAYHQSALKWHPDKWQHCPEVLRAKAEAKFKAVVRAYETLSVPESRNRYDRTCL